jgi:hypothetical protein
MTVLLALASVMPSDCWNLSVTDKYLLSAEAIVFCLKCELYALSSLHTNSVYRVQVSQVFQYCACDVTCRPQVMIVSITKRELCGLVVRGIGYRSGGPGSIPGTTKKKEVGLECGPLSLVSTTEELLDRKVAAPV